MDTAAALPPLAVCFDKDRRVVCEISQAKLKKILSLLRNNNYLGTKTRVPLHYQRFFSDGMDLY